MMRIKRGGRGVSVFRFRSAVGVSVREKGTVAGLGTFAFFLLKHWPTETQKHFFPVFRFRYAVGVSVREKGTVAWLGTFAVFLPKHWPTETLKHLFALSRRSRTCAQAGSEGAGKILKGGGLEGGFAQAAQAGFVLNGFVGVA